MGERDQSEKEVPPSAQRGRTKKHAENANKARVRTIVEEREETFISHQGPNRGTEKARKAQKKQISKEVQPH